MIASQKNSALSSATNSRDARQQVSAGMSQRLMETALRAVSSLRGATVSPLATVAPFPPYSRRWLHPKFDAAFLPLASNTRLAERVSITRSAFFGAFIQTVVAIFGAFSARRFNVNPSSTILTAPSSGSKLPRAFA